MLKIAEMRGDVMSRFHNVRPSETAPGARQMHTGCSVCVCVCVCVFPPQALMLGQVEERVKIMAEMGQACCNLDGAVL